jgi:hypothetical protein
MHIITERRTLRRSFTPTPNDELERPGFERIRAQCAHNSPGAHSAPP